MGLSFYEAFNFTGTYKQFALLEIEYIGGYSTKLTWMLSFLFYALVFLVVYAEGKKSFAPVFPGRVASTETDGSFEELLRRYRKALYAFIAFMVLGFLGGRDLYGALQVERRESVSLNEIERNPAAFKLILSTSITGTLLFAEEATWREHVTTHYVPFVSPEWKEGTPVAVVVEIVGTQFARARNAKAVRGIIGREALPADIAARWNSTKAPIQDATLLLEFDEDPERLRIFGLKVLGIGIAALLLGLILAHRARRNP